MKLLTTLCLLLSLTYSWAIYSPIENLNLEDCVRLILIDNQEIKVVITRKDQAYTYYYNCGDTTQKPRSIKNSNIKEILQIEADVAELIPCEKLILTNADSITVEVIHVDSVYMYFHVCGKSHLPERKLKLAFIASRKNTFIQKGGTQAGSPIVESNLGESKKASPSTKAGVLSFISGFILSPLIGLISAQRDVEAYSRNSIIVAFLLAIFILFTNTNPQLRILTVLVSLIGSVIGIFLVPIVIGLLFG